LGVFVELDEQPMTLLASPSWSHLNLSLDADRATLAAHFRETGVRDVECLFADVTGYPRGKLMPAASFAAGSELRICQAIPMQCVTGEYSYDPVFPDSDPDVRLVPDLATLNRSPWASVPRYLAVHDAVEMDGSLCEFAPRSVLKNVVARYAAAGLIPVVAPEGRRQSSRRELLSPVLSIPGPTLPPDLPGIPYWNIV
jgi:glutamine synthetase